MTVDLPKVPTKAKYKKKGRNNRDSSPMGKHKYGVYVPKSVEVAQKIDKENGNSLWADTICKEIGVLNEMGTFKALEGDDLDKFNKSKSDYQYAPLQIIFDVKQDLHRRHAWSLVGM